MLKRSSRRDLDVFAHIPRHSLPERHARRIKESYRARRFDQVFPAGSSAMPSLLIGRERQISQLSSLAREMLDDTFGARQSLIGVVLHGPRGTGKTALLNAFSEGIRGLGRVRIINMVGNDHLVSTDTLIRHLASFAPARSEKTRSFALGAKMVVAGGFETRTTRRESHQSLSSISSALHAATERKKGKRMPVLITIDEAHAASPAELGGLLNAIQNVTNQGEVAVGIVLAGTPDLLDLLRHRKCEATWFLDRAGTARRLAPMPNDLSHDDCLRAITEPLKCAGVTVTSMTALSGAVEKCKGSPYFLQVLGETALATAFENNHLADFSTGGEIHLIFDENVQARYKQTWASLDNQGLAGCARQLGALWQARTPDGEPIKITENLVDRAIRSGLEHAPTEAGMTTDEAISYFKHLGLLWSFGEGAQDVWSLGLPSFFDFAEAMFHRIGNVDHRAVLPELQSDMSSLYEEVGLAVKTAIDGQ